MRGVHHGLDVACAGPTDADTTRMAPPGVLETASTMPERSFGNFRFCTRTLAARASDRLGVDSRAVRMRAVGFRYAGIALSECPELMACYRTAVQPTRLTRPALRVRCARAPARRHLKMMARRPCFEMSPCSRTHSRANRSGLRRGYVSALALTGTTI